MLSLAALPLSWVAAQIVTQIIHSRVIERILSVCPLRRRPRHEARVACRRVVWSRSLIDGRLGLSTTHQSLVCARPIVWLHLFPGRLDVAAPSTFSGGSARLALGLVL